MKLTKTRAALLALVAALALSACGDDDDDDAGSTSGSTTSTTSSPAATPKGPAFKIGLLCSCSGAGAAALAHEDEVFEAWAKSVNAKGGINGHPVEVSIEDDANNPATALQAYKELAAKNVVAIVDGSLQDGQWGKEASKDGIPVVGGLTVGPPMFTDPNFFPSGAVLPPVILAQILEMKEAGKKHMGVAYCAEVPVCAQLEGLVKAAAGVAGGVEVTGQSISMTAPNYTAPCLKFKEDGADTLFIGAVSPVVVRVVDACAQQNYKPLNISQTTTSSSDWLKNSNMNDTILIDSQAPWFSTDVPGVAEFTKALEEYAPDIPKSPQFNADDLSPWTGGKLFQAAAEAGKLTPASKGADVKAAMYLLKNETLDGLSGPLTYVKGKPSFPACYFVVKVEDGEFTTPKGTEPTCPPAAQVQKLGAALAKAGG